MEIALADVKTFCRIDGESEDGLLQTLILAAKEYLAGAGVPDPDTDSPLYGLCVKNLVLEYYDKRGLTEAPAPNNIPGIRNAVTQLKLSAEAERAAAEEAGT